MSIFDLYNSPRQFANSAINNLSKTQVIAPKKTLQDAYNEAMSKNTPTWAMALSNAMPAIGEIVASQAIKDPWQQESVAGSLERQKDRQQAYNQFLQQQENEKAKDFVAMAKEQLGLDRADEDREYNRELANLQRNDAYEKAKQALAQQEFENSLKENTFDIDKALKTAQTNKLNAEAEALKNKPAELTAEDKIKEGVAMEEAKENAKNKRAAQQALKEAKAGQKAFEDNIKYLEDLSKKTGNVLDRSIGGIASYFTGKNTGITAPNNAMSELVAQIKQAALVASGISGEGDDKAQQAKLKDIYRRAGVDENAKSLSQAEASSIINNIKNIYKQRVAEKQNLLDSFNDNNFSATWRQ